MPLIPGNNKEREQTMQMLSHMKKVNNRYLVFALLIMMSSCKTEKQENNAVIPESGNKIMLSEAQMQLANIKVSEAEEQDISNDLTLTGVLKVNEQSAVIISSRTTGRIEKLFYKNIGETVHKGDSLYRIYSDEIVASEREYITLQNNNWNFSGKFEPSITLENKLILLGMLPSQVAGLKKNGKILFTVTIYSPVNGTIRSLNVSEGQYVSPGATLLELADDNQLWIEANAYQNDVKNIKPGLPATVIIPVAGNMSVRCNIGSVNPSFEQGKNSILVRSLIDNPGKKIYPGMLATMRVQTSKTRGIAVPVSAVISGKDGDRIWIKNEDGSFSARQVTTGIQSENSILVLSGLKRTEMVVTSGAYLLNSELILKKGSVTKLESEL
jgi:membrane fusion protein, copper/silver efflux system